MGKSISLDDALDELQEELDKLEIGPDEFTTAQFAKRYKLTRTQAISRLGYLEKMGRVVRVDRFVLTDRLHTHVWRIIPSDQEQSSNSNSLTYSER